MAHCNGVLVIGGSTNCRLEIPFCGSRCCVVLLAGEMDGEE